jgi:hypothetical protein
MASFEMVWYLGPEREENHFECEMLRWDDRSFLKIAQDTPDDPESVPQQFLAEATFVAVADIDFSFAQTLARKKAKH